MNFQDLIFTLQSFWGGEGAVLLQAYDRAMGAGTFHPATFLRSVSPDPWSCAYVQPCRRPTDGRYGENPNRLGQYYQFQVLMKPSPTDIQALYLRSLEAIGIDLKKHDVRFVEDDWESPTLGAWGLGWEVWLDGMEITQFTYFQQVGGIELTDIPVEITYGLERLAMYVQNIDNVYDLVWVGKRGHPRCVTYGDVYRRNELEQAVDNFEAANGPVLESAFQKYAASAEDLLARECTLPAYECVMDASHVFNLMQASGTISVAERQRYMLAVRSLACRVANQYRESASLTAEERYAKTLVPRG